MKVAIQYPIPNEADPNDMFRVDWFITETTFPPQVGHYVNVVDRRTHEDLEVIAVTWYYPPHEFSGEAIDVLVTTR